MVWCLRKRVEQTIFSPHVSCVKCSHTPKNVNVDTKMHGEQITLSIVKMVVVQIILSTLNSADG